MIIKKSASLNGLQLVMRPVLVIASSVWVDYGQELTVTCGTDGTHSAGSLHYYGLALDLRTKYFNEKTKFKVFKDLKDKLGSKYDVVMHTTHIHVEHDPEFK